MATMNPAAAGGVPYRVPPEPKRLPSFILAGLMHAGLLFFLWAGVNWQNTEPVSVEAEMWDMKVQSAAAPPEPQPEPVREPEPEPIPRVALPPVEEPVAAKAPDIALERIKEQKLRDKKLAEEKIEKEKELKKEKKLLEELRQKELADKKALEKADKLAKAAKEAAEEKTLQKLRDAEMKRITGAAGTSGTAEKSTAPRSDPGYVAAITAKILSSSKYIGERPESNPRVVFQIDQLPTGEIMSVKLVKSSGLDAFDDAVERGIRDSSPLPKKKDGTVVRSIELGFTMKEVK